MLDLRFPTALQLMQTLAMAERVGIGFVNSAKLADGLAANPTLVRRVLGALVDRGLLESQRGRVGGVRLGKPADQITLRDIYEPVTAGKKMWSGRNNLSQHCVIGANFEEFFSALVGKADEAMLDTLAARTLAATVDDVLEIARKKGPLDIYPHLRGDHLEQVSLQAG